MGVKILSLFDGMACGMIAMQLAGVEVESYDAYEIDKYAIKTAQHNFPMIKEHGDVFDADFTQYEGVDFLIGGSPCTYWSIAQTKNRETVASGMGWELFSQYVRALHEAKPKYFIYEDNKSMSKQIRASIDEAFGFEAVLINSALVSAQNRQRLYWVGRRNADGTYSKVNVEQPEDRGILLKDVLDSAVARDIAAEPINTDANEKAFCLTSRYYKGFGNNPGKCLEKHRDSMVAEPVCVAERGRMYCGQPQHYEARTDGKTNTLTSVEKDNRVAEPVACRCRGRVDASGNGYAKYECREDGKANTLDTNTVNGAMVAEPVECKTIINSIPEIAEKFGYVPEMFNAYNRAEITDKAPTLSTGSMDTSSCAVNRFEDVCGYATLCEWDESGNPTKAVSAADGKTYTVYEVKDGQITIKGKQYPIKLKDGYYIIRKLTVSECKRLQTVPEWYEFPVSNSQAYKMLGNGWTCEVIAHLILSCNGVL